jgi:mRNA-degrading endonuclease toxin of MazEF toxin-antitoxin module
LRCSQLDRDREDAVKDHPCVIILAAQARDDAMMVTVAPITHALAIHGEAAVEIPHPTKRRLGLDSTHSWIIVSEVNRFAWPGPDIRPIGPNRFDDGFLPPSLFRQLLRKSAAHYAARPLRIVPRTE